MTPGAPLLPRPVLLVEDDPDDAELTFRALKKARVANPVDHVQDGEAALDYLDVRRTRPGRTDFPVLILLDLKLPKLSGYEVLNRLDGEGVLKDLPVIVVTSSKRQEDVLEGYSLGIRSFVRKPVDFRKLGDAAAKLGIGWMLVEKPSTS
ncbi:MAG: response regulator [Planctomycetaceae bacterium]|nr:response regulator [Planctomycetaceae bacterium]